MTSYVLVLIGDRELYPLSSIHIDRVFQHLAIAGRKVWLAVDEACDLFIESARSAADLTRAAREALSGTQIDVVCRSEERRVGKEG